MYRKPRRMANEIPAHEVLKIINPLLYSIRFLKGENNAIRQANQRLQAIIDELRSADFRPCRVRPCRISSRARRIARRLSWMPRLKRRGRRL